MVCDGQMVARLTRSWAKHSVVTDPDTVPPPRRCARPSRERRTVDRQWIEHRINRSRPVSDRNGWISTGATQGSGRTEWRVDPADQGGRTSTLTSVLSLITRIGFKSPCLSRGVRRGASTGIGTVSRREQVQVAVDPLHHHPGFRLRGTVRRQSVSPACDPRCGWLPCR